MVRLTIDVHKYPINLDELELNERMVADTGKFRPGSRWWSQVEDRTGSSEVEMPGDLTGIWSSVAV